MYKLTKHGKEVVEDFIKSCNEEKEKILNVGLDTSHEEYIPTIEDIEDDIGVFIDKDGDYYNYWGITDNYNSSNMLCLKENVDFIEI